MTKPKNPVRVLAGLKGAVRRAEAMVLANKHDIALGLDFHHLLKANTVKQLIAEAKLQNYKREQGIK